MLDAVVDFFYKINDFFMEVSDWMLDKLSIGDPKVIGLTVLVTLLGYAGVYIMPSVMGAKEYDTLSKVLITVLLPIISYVIIRKMTE